MKLLETLLLNNWKIGLKSERELLCWQKFWIGLGMKCLCRLAIRLAKYSIYWEHISTTWPEYRKKKYVDTKNYFNSDRKIKGKWRWWGLNILLKRQISLCAHDSTYRIFCKGKCHCLAYKEFCVSCPQEVSCSNCSFPLPHNSEEKEIMSSRGREDAH